MHALERQCFSLPWSEAQCRAAFAQRAFAAFGLLRGDSLVAYISLYHALDELEILNLAVSPGERRKGLGRRLLRLALRLGGKMGMHKAVLEVRRSNAAALALYESCGFRCAGVRRNYYADTGEDGLVCVAEMPVASPPHGVPRGA